MDITITTQEVLGLMNSAPSWCPVELTALSFTTTTTFSNPVTLEWETAAAFNIWYQYGLGGEFSSAVRHTATTYAVSYVLEDHGKMDRLAREPDFEEALLAWLEAQPEVSKTFSVTDLVLLTWKPRKMSVYAPYGYSGFMIDVSQEELASFGASRSCPYVLPRAVAQAHPNDPEYATYEVRELIGTVFADEAEAEATLALWETGRARWEAAGMESFTHARDIARAL